MGLMFGILWSVGPLIYDDLDYRSGWTKPFCDSPSFDIPWNYLADQLRFRFEKDNLRLANLFFLLVCWMPKWILGMSTGVVAGFDIFMVTKLACSKDSWLSACLAASYAYIFLLGQHLFLSIDFAFNYIWGSAFFLVTWYLFSENHIRRPLPLYVIVGLLTGCWHEGFAASIVGGFCLAGVYKYNSEGKFLNKRQLALTASVALGVILLICVPGMWHRLWVEKETISHNPLGVWGMLRFIASSFRPLLLPFLIFIILRLLGIRLSSRSIENFLIISGIFVINMSVGVLSDFSAYPRQCFSNLVAGTIGLLITINALIFHYKSWKRYIKIITLVSILLMTVSVSFGIVGISKIKSRYEYAIDCFVKNPEEVIYLKLTLPNEEELLRYIPNLVGIYWDMWANMCVNSYTYTPDNDVRMKIVSEELRNFSLSDSHKDEDTGILYYHKLAVIELPDSVYKQAPAYATLIMSDKQYGVFELPGTIVPFYSITEGRWFGQIIPSLRVNSIFSLPRRYDGRILEWKYDVYE